MAKILVVDDDADYCDLLKLFLEGKGHTVLAANTVKNALTLFSQQSPEIIISDILMPETDGIEFLLQIQKSGDQALVGIIMISGGGMSEADPYLKMAKSLGATQVFAKPVSLKKLDQAIEDMLDATK